MKQLDRDVTTWTGRFERTTATGEKYLDREVTKWKGKLESTTSAGEKQLDREVKKWKAKFESATADGEKLKVELTEASTAAQKPAPKLNATQPSCSTNVKGEPKVI